MLHETMKGFESVVENINDRNTNVGFFDKETNMLFGRDYIVDYIGDLKFNISARYFFQVNPMKTKVLYKKALELQRQKSAKIRLATAS